MTREILNNICKTRKVNLDWYDHINAFINENYTKVFITFAQMEVFGGGRMFCNQKTVTLSGIDNSSAFRNSVAYIQNWMQALKNDPKMIVWAASRAEKAARYIIGGPEAIKQAVSAA